MSLNVVALTGRAGKDVEIKYMPSGKAVANISMAVDYGSGEDKKTSWIDVVCFQKTAEIAAESIRKGTLFAVNGYLQSRNWEDRAGNTRKSTEVVCVNITFLEPKRENSEKPKAQPVQEVDPKNQGEIMDEDIPF